MERQMRYMAIAVTVCLAIPLYGVSVSDNFDRSDQSLYASTNWSPDYILTSSQVIRSNVLKSTETSVGNYYKARWIGTSLVSSNYYIQASVYVSSGEPINTFAPGGRMTNGTGATNDDGYAASPWVDDAFYLSRIDNSGETILGSWGTPAHATTYVMKLTCNGNALTVNIDGTDRISTTDATYSSGGVGIFDGIFGGVTIGMYQHSLDNWEARDLEVSAIKPLVLILE